MPAMWPPTGHGAGVGGKRLFASGERMKKRTMGEDLTDALQSEPDVGMPSSLWLRKQRLELKREPLSFGLY